MSKYSRYSKKHIIFSKFHLYFLVFIWGHGSLFEDQMTFHPGKHIRHKQIFRSSHTHETPRVPLETDGINSGLDECCSLTKGDLKAKQAAMVSAGSRQRKIDPNSISLPILTSTGREAK
jgi:hypothetical protein